MRARLIFLLFMLYTLLFGATYTGVVTASTRILDVVLVGVVAIFWLTQRRQWHHTPIDAAILLWGAAFALSFVTNLESWRRIAIGLWFMGVYIGAWFFLQDMTANRILRRDWLADALLITGVPVVFVGFAQVELALTRGQPLPRPVGTLGNANTLAAFLVILIPFLLGRLAAARRPVWRVLYGFYTVASLLLLLLSFSRGGWIAGGAEVVVWVHLRYSLPRLWRRLPPIGRIAAALAVIAVLVVGGYVIIESLGLGGRGLELRTFIYNTAIEMFKQRPVTGWGLFTFGAGLSRFNSIPPVEPHSHAHNIILHVAAELGIVGLLALALTVWLILRATRRPGDALTHMGIAAFVGFSVHLIFDLPAMMPTIALAALIALVLAVPAEVPARRPWPRALLIVGGLLLTGFGLWEALHYNTYINVLSTTIADQQYRAGADALQPLINADPSLAIYYQEQGTLYGLAAEAGDSQAAALGITAFQHYAAIDPVYPMGYANIAALYSLSHQPTLAENWMQQAVDHAPESWPLVYKLGQYAEAAGDTAAAQSTYQQAIKLDRDLPLLPDWDASPLRQSLRGADSDRSPLAQTLLLLESGQIDAARQFWQVAPTHTLNLSEAHVMSLLLALAAGDRATAQTELRLAQNAAYDLRTQTWAQIGAVFLNLSPQFDRRIAVAQAALFGGPVDLGMGFRPQYRLCAVFTSGDPAPVLARAWLHRGRCAAAASAHAGDSESRPRSSRIANGLTRPANPSRLGVTDGSFR